MGDRVFAIVTLADVAGLLNPAGQAVVAAARHSLDGTQIVLDFNHHRTTVDSLFVNGADVDAVITGCEMLSHAETTARMGAIEWLGDWESVKNG